MALLRGCARGSKIWGKRTPQFSMAQSAGNRQAAGDSVSLTKEVSMDGLLHSKRTRTVLQACLLMATAALPVTMRGQSGRNDPINPRVLNGGNNGSRNTSVMPMPGVDMGIGDIEETPQLRVRRENLRKVQRKERMVSSANRLLALTKQFQADLVEHPEMTPENAKRLDDIAKLAHEVKARMQE